MSTIQPLMTKAIADNRITLGEVEGWIKAGKGTQANKAEMMEALEHWGTFFEVKASDRLAKYLNVTEPNIEGPWYKPGAPLRPDGVLPGPRQGAEPLTVSGVVVDQQGTPVKGAKLDLWQADHRPDGTGVYYEDKAFTFRGVVSSDDKGAYTFKSVIPGHYPLNQQGQLRPAHIHVKLTAPGFKPLTTQLYFENDPHNAKDPFVRPSLIMPLSKGPEGTSANFRFVLAKE